MKHYQSLKFQVLTSLTIFLVLSVSSCQTEEEFPADSFGNKTQRQAVNFLIEESNRYTSKLNRAVESTGNSASSQPNFETSFAPGGSGGKTQSSKLPPPRGSLEKLRETAKDWKEKTPKSDKELRLVYIRFQKVFSSFEILEEKLVDYPSFNSQLGQHGRLMGELTQGVKAIEKRPEGFKVKR